MAAISSVGIGETVEGRFEIESILGRGGFGTVYKARQMSTGQPVAIKVLHRDRVDDEGVATEEVARFQREMELIGQLKHPNIVRLIDSGTFESGEVYTVLEFIEGETLAQLLDRDGGLHPRDATRIMSHVLEALSCAHDCGIVHRDLKPQNIMVTTSGARRSALVLDFGIAAVVEGSRGKDYRTLTATGQFQGTPCYMAPEQLREKKLTPQTDIYAWGLVFIEALSGYPAVMAESFAEIIYRQMSPEPVPIPEAILKHPLGAIIQRAVSKPLEKRFSDATTALGALETCRSSVSFQLPLYTNADGASLADMFATTGAVEVAISDTNPGGPADFGSAESPRVEMDTDKGEVDSIDNDDEVPARPNRLPWIVAGALAALLLAAVAFIVINQSGSDPEPIPGEQLATKDLSEPGDSAVATPQNKLPVAPAGAKVAGVEEKGGDDDNPAADQQSIQPDTLETLGNVGLANTNDVPNALEEAQQAPPEVKKQSKKSKKKNQKKSAANGKKQVPDIGEFVPEEQIAITDDRPSESEANEVVFDNFARNQQTSTEGTNAETVLDAAAKQAQETAVLNRATNNAEGGNNDANEEQAPDVQQAEPTVQQAAEPTPQKSSGSKKSRPQSKSKSKSKSKK